MAWTKHVADGASIENSRAGVRRLRRRGARVQLGRLQGRRREGQDARHARQRSAGARSGRTRSKLDPKMFGGKAMTYYGRWTYKYESGAKRGAAGVLIVHETGPAGYPFAVVQGNLGEQFDLVTPDKNMGRAAIEGWISLDAAKKLFAMAGQDFDALKKQAVDARVQAGAARRDRVDGDHEHDAHDRLAQRVAKLEGSDPQLKNEYVVYTAHWDHLGVGDPVNGDRIYNGALDNAVGRRGAARDRARVHAAAAAAEAVDPVPDGHRRGAGPARLAVLLGDARLSAGEDAGQHQHGRRQPVGPHQGPHGRRPRRLGSRRLPARRRRRAGARRCGRIRSRRRASTTAPITSTSPSRACRRSTPTPASTSSASRRTTASRSATSTPNKRLPQAVRRGEAGLGSERRARGRAAAASRSATGWRRPTSIPEWKPGNEFKAKRDAMLKK